MKKLIENLKKIALVILVFYATDALSQTQKIHTLQVTDGTITESMSTDALIQLDSKNKGLLLPRVALTDAKKPAPLATHTVGMTVYNTATVSSTATVEGVTPGYYYNNGTKWVRLTDTNDQEWVYDPTTKQINLKRSGNAPFKRQIYYNEKGKFGNFDEDETFVIISSPSGSFVNQDVSMSLNEEQKSLSDVDVVQTFNSKNNTGYTDSQNGVVTKIGIRNNYLVNKIDASENHFVLRNGMFVPKNNSNNYGYIYNNSSGVSLSGSGNISSAIGKWGNVSIGGVQKISGYATGMLSESSYRGSGNVRVLLGTYSRIFYFQGTGTVDIGATINSTSYSPDPSISSALVKQNYGILNSITSDSQNTGTGVELAGISNAVSLSGKTSYPDVYGIKSSVSIASAATKPKNAYGLFLGGVQGATANNYAIYTNKGISSFGDDVQIRNINTQVSTDPKHKIIVADATGKLRVSDASIKPNPASNSWTLTGNGGTNPATNFIGTTDNQALNIRTNNTNKITVLPNGNVGIGTTTPKNELDVAGGIRAINPKSGVATTGSDGLYYTMSSDEQPHYDTETGIISTALTKEEAKRSSIFLQVADTYEGKNYGRIQLVSGFTEISRKLVVGKSDNTSANLPTESLYVHGAAKFLGKVEATGWTTSSDKRFKKGIGALNIGLASLSKLRPVSYYWNAKGKEQGGDTKEHLGFIAQEIEKVLPNLVSTDKEGYKSVNYIEMIPVLTKAIQEQQKENNELKQRVDKLEALVQQLLK